MNYRDMDLNARINLKGTYEQFLRIAVDKFRKAQTNKIYKARVKRVIGEGSKARVRYLKRTRYLYNNFDTGLTMYNVMDILTIKFPLYGRFVDMGVGGNTNSNEALLRKRYSIHRSEVKRTPKRWYSKTKSGQELKLAEILKEKYSIGLVSIVENLLNQTVEIK